MSWYFLSHHHVTYRKTCMALSGSFVHNDESDNQLSRSLLKCWYGTFHRAHNKDSLFCWTIHHWRKPVVSHISVYILYSISRNPCSCLLYTGSFMNNANSCHAHMGSFICWYFAGHNTLWLMRVWMIGGFLLTILYIMYGFYNTHHSVLMQFVYIGIHGHFLLWNSC